MSVCLRCGREEAAHAFRALEVRTLAVRDLTGEKRVQALGRFVDASICRECAGKRLAEIAAPGRALGRKAGPFLLILLFGLGVTLLLRPAERAILLMGAAAVICGAAGLASSVREILRKKKEYRALPPEEAERRAAWESFLCTAPQKEGENDLTYIPVNEETLAMKNGDLMIAYRLLPAIAKEAWRRLHPEAGTSAKGESAP